MKISRIPFASLIIAGALATAVSTANADLSAFHSGPVFPNYGKIATIDSDMKIPRRTKFKVSFDTSKQAKAGGINKTLESAARFINMHAEAGVPVKNLKVAVVIHGKASFDLTKQSKYGPAMDGADNANAGLITALTSKGVRIYLCGQSAAYYGIDNTDLLPNVDMALSAMTAHALLQQDGYTLNPF